MSTPYTYLIKHAPTGMLYYGVRYAEDCTPEDLWDKYFTSSNKVKDLIEEYGAHTFEVEIRKTFKSKTKAIEWEEKVLRRMKIPHRQDFLNHRYAYGLPSMTGESHPLWGVGHTESARKKMSVAHTGKTLSEKTRRKMSESRTGEGNHCFGKFGSDHPAYGNKHSEEFKRSLSERLKSNNHMLTDAARQKMSETKRGKSWWNNGTNSKQSKECPGDGWVKGRKMITLFENKVTDYAKGALSGDWGDVWGQET